MMQDQPKNILTNYYRKKIQETVDYLKIKYSLEECEKNDKDIPEEIILDIEPYNFYKINTTSNLKDYTLILAIPDSFPDNFPKIFLSKKDFQNIYPIPHLNKSRFICTMDPETVILSDKKPNIAVEKLIEIATEIIEKGIKKENNEDFIKEFLAYWNEQKKFTFLSLFYPSADCKPLILFELSKKIFNCSYILTDSEEKLAKWLIPFGINKKIISEAFYIPVSKFNPFSINRNEEILEILKDCSDKCLNYIEKYFNQNISNRIIISSFLLNNEEILFGWQHQRMANEQFKGFRNNRIPLKVRLTYPKYRDLSIEKIEIKRMDKDRIFKRGGTINNFLKKDIKLTFFGVGSIGSFLAMSLCRVGISDLVLVDKDTLNPENTPRHLCGFLEASQEMKKVDAVKKRLTEHFPYLKCTVYDNDIFELLKEDKLNFKDCDLLIISLANYALERRINFLQQKGKIICPILYLWIEPYGVGGQILYINGKNEGCFECCFDANGNFIYSITREEDKFQKRESGCQSTFLPYSSTSVEQFIAVVVKKIINILQGYYKENMSFTWIGDIKEFESLKYRVKSQYAAKSSFSLIKRIVSKNKLCHICGEKE